MITFSDSMHILNLELFDAAFAIDPGSEDEVRRRFMTLFVSDANVRRGGSAQISQATNALGETFAVKSLRAELIERPLADKVQATPARKELRHSVGSSGSAGSPTPDYVTQGHVVAFYEEYRIHLAVSRLRGFAQLYGFGLAGGQPVIVMEWVEGTTLREAMRARSLSTDDPLPLLAVASLGRTTLTLLNRAGELSDSFVHRDLSPRNIMLREDRTTAQEQLATASFDLCLIDFGSSTLTAGESDPTFTMRTNIWRMGTPDYAPPEMLTSDVALPESYRNSPAIDVYALCSVLYELYGGAQPFDLSAHHDLSPYRIKTETTPQPLVPREPDGGALAAIITAGLSAQPEERPSIRQLDAALANWQELPSERSVASPHAAKPSDFAVWQPGTSRKLVTRRHFVSAGLVAASTFVSGSFVARKMLLSREPQLNESRYPRTDVPYQGPPLYRAFDGAFDSWALVTPEGAIACKPSSSRPCGPLREGLVALFDDFSQRYGYVAPTDVGDAYAWVILPRYSGAADFSEGRAAAQDPVSKLWGYLDVQGSWAIEPQFDEAALFSQGVAAVRSKSGLWGAIDASGNWVIEPAFATIGRRSGDGLAAAQSPKGLWGIVDEVGDWVCKPQSCQLRRYDHGLAPAFDDERERWGFVDAHGAWAIPPTFASARPFYVESPESNLCLAAAQDPVTLLWHFITPDGTSQTDPMLWKLGDLCDGLAPAQATAEDDTLAFDDRDPDSYVEGVGMRYGYVDAQGTWQMRRLTTLTDTCIGPAEV